MSGIGYLIAPAVTSALTAIVSVWVMKRRSSIELEQRAGEIALQTKQQAAEAMKEPIAIYKAEVEKRDAVIAQMRAEDRADRGQFLSALSSMNKTLETMAEDIVKIREEAIKRSGEMHERLNAMALQIASK